MSVTEKLGGYASVAASAGRSAGAATLKSRTALVDAVGRLVDAAVDRVLLSDDRVTSAADGKLRLSGQTGTEELADKVQRVVVLATPFVRAAARGAKFTKLPWALIASSSFSVGVAVRTGVREIRCSLRSSRSGSSTRPEHLPTHSSSRKWPLTCTSGRSGRST